MFQLSQNVPTISECPNYLKMSQLYISKCPKYLKMSQLAISKCSNFQQRINFMKKYSLDKNQGCAEICEMTEFMQNYAVMLKYAKMCSKHQIVRKVAENVKLCDSTPVAHPT